MGAIWVQRPRSVAEEFGVSHQAPYVHFGHKRDRVGRVVLAVSTSVFSVSIEE